MNYFAKRSQTHIRLRVELLQQKARKGTKWGGHPASLTTQLLSTVNGNRTVSGLKRMQVIELATRESVVRHRLEDERQL